jgi:hypothetical protein
MRITRKAVTITLGAVILLGAGYLAGAALNSNRKTGASAPSSSSPTPTPSPIASPSPSPSPSPEASPVPVKPLFVLVTADWQNCAGPSHCYAHGIFQNNGTGAGSVAVTFRMPPASGFSQSCATIVPSTAPGSVGEASCDLGATASLYYGESSQNSRQPPGVAINNP